ncbi:oligosaccharyltransferase complex subunit alpha (ribophorin I) [Kwoniella heveanensis BCC8398]|uniref:Dolichyl-diphosphooligosaccharide--protein glycosyltransferase subunit 1 n=1 Tax=Kwoniella heveanensis BCC8398 TaxID=1296120 RepID=A0A1B9GNI2_9TREE|nr:oligosaccharyltransferase complex subunit alpha (ribophorin I) [Kwoniella heveanensis BCC8398]
MRPPSVPLSLAGLASATASLPLALAALSAPPQEYVNTAIARTIELGGLTTQVTTQYNIKALSDVSVNAADSGAGRKGNGARAGEYWLALAEEDGLEPAYWEVSIGGKKVEGVRLLDESPPTAAVPLGKMKKDDVITLSLTHVLTHTSSPLPAEIEQKDQQYLQWNSNSTYVDSWYETDVERVKIRAPHPSILSYATVPDTYTRDNTITKSGGTLTLGPFHSVPRTLGPDSKVAQQSFSVHYETKDPVIGVKKLRRAAEVSHWGANLNIQDEIELVNMGPKLKGHFSRLAHQQSRFHGSYPAQILRELTIKLPATAHSPYYYDTIGNVSTSHFRPGSVPAQKAKSSKVRTSPRVVDGNLELRPRYPLLGGWNYSFTVGWDTPLQDVLKVDAKDGKKVLAVPFLTGLSDVVVDDAEVKIILPEGASAVQIYTPFPVDSIEHSIHKTYLDTTGRHAITLKKARCTSRHDQDVYVTYHYPLSAQLQKPIAVGSLVASLFILGMALRRVNYSIDKKQTIVVE